VEGRGGEGARACVYMYVGVRVCFYVSL